MESPGQQQGSVASPPLRGRKAALGGGGGRGWEWGGRGDCTQGLSSDTVGSRDAP